MKTKSKRRIIAAVAWLAFLVLLVVVDGMERFVIPIGRGAAFMFGLAAVWAAGLWKAGWIRR